MVRPAIGHKTDAEPHAARNRDISGLSHAGNPRAEREKPGSSNCGTDFACRALRVSAAGWLCGRGVGVQLPVLDQGVDSAYPAVAAMIGCQRVASKIRVMDSIRPSRSRKCSAVRWIPTGVAVCTS
jgi:hypothetical protein